jgi:prepilin signal peptidase PulO-like enzyme (type II secretory pathway)
VNPLVVAGLAAGGALVGLGSGWVAVRLEQVEKLEDEEAEERHQYETDVAARAAAAVGEGQPEPAALPWLGERYGWTWLELVLSPLLGAAGFACFAAHDGLGGGLAIHLLWVAVFVHIVTFDLKHRLILNRVTYPTIAVAIGLSPVSPGLTIGRALAGAAIVYAFFLVQSLLLGGSVLGMGDAKLGAIVGATTGLGLDTDHLGAVYAVIAAVLAGGVVAVLLLITRIRGLKDPIPYGPFLCAGAALIIFVGPSGATY